MADLSGLNKLFLWSVAQLDDGPKEGSNNNNNNSEEKKLQKLDVILSLV